MKLLIVLGLAAAALATYWDTERGFETGKEYHFEWKGQVTNGLAVDGSSQHSIQQITSQVYLSFSEEHTVWLRFGDVRFTAGQEQLRDPRLHNKLDLDETELSREQRDILSLPVRFRYQNGVVSELQFGSEDKPWSQNIKRAVINMLQLNLSNKKNEQQYMDTGSESSRYDHFTVQERTLEGECEVAYTVVKGEKNELEVTKSLNFNKCTKRVDIRYNYRFGQQWPETFRTQNSLPESQTIMSYKIVGTEKRFLINEVELKSEYVIAPLHKEQPMIATTVHNKLRLMNVSDKMKRFDQPELTKKTSLIYNYETELAREQFWQTGSEAAYKKSDFVDINRVETVSKLIKQAIKHIENEKSGVQLEATQQMTTITEVLRMCNKQDINEIHSQIFLSKKYDERTMDIVRGLLSDTLATAGTRTTLTHVFKKIANKEVGTIKAAELLKKIAQTRVPSVEIVDDIVKLCQSDISLRSSLIKQSCWLTAGALMNGACGRNQDLFVQELEDNKKCTREQKTNFVDIVKKQYEMAESRYEKTLALKVIANAGIDVSVHFLQSIIYDKNQEKTIRVQAIDALRQLRSQMPRKVQQILMPVFKSRTEQPEIRMTAIHHIMHTWPERATIEQVIEQLNNERNQQVVSFTYSLIKNFAKSENPRENKIAQDCKVALRMLSKNVILSSRNVRLPIYSETFNTGASAEFSAIFNNETVFPKEIVASIDTLFAGNWNKYLAQIGFTQQNFDTVLFKLWKKFEQSEEYEKFVTRGQRSSLETSVSYLRQLSKKMSVESRRSGSEEAHAMMYIRHKNLDYAVLPIDEKTINDFIKTVFRNGKVEISEIERMLSRGFHFNTQTSAFLYETSRFVATSIGLPIKVNNKMPTVASVHGMIKVEFNSKTKPSGGFSIRVLAHPTVATTHISEMRTLAPFLHNGVKTMHSVQFNLPIDTLLHINWQNKFQIKTIVKVPETEKRIALIQTRPTTFIRRFSEKQVQENEEKTVYVSKFDKTNLHYERTYGEELLGIKMNVFGSVHRHMLDDDLQPLLVGENHIEISFEPTTKNTRELVFEMETALNNDRSLNTPVFDNFADTELLTVETLEDDVSETEIGRRSSLTKYIKNLNIKDSYKNRLVLKAYTVGSSEERSAEMELLSVCDKTFRYCKMEIIAKRTPLFEETREWQMKTSIETLFPEMPTTLKQYKDQKHREFQAVMESQWGSEKKNVLKMKIQGEQDRNMQQLTKNIEYENNREGLNNYEQLLKVAQLNQYKIVADYEFAPTTKKSIGQFCNYIQTNLFGFYKIEPVNKQNGQVFVKITVEPETRRYVNLTVQTPTHRIQLQEFRTTFRMPLLNIAQNMKLNKARGLSHRAECEVMSSKVRTFDNLLYKTPLTTCYSVLAKDCSEEPQFAVLIKKVTKSGEEKKVKIISEDNTIEIELVEEKLVCTVNGNKIRDELRLEEYGVEMINEQLCQIVLPEVTMKFDGYTVKMHMSHRMQNKQCGICGHFDGQSDNDFRRADNIETENIEEFHRSWLVRDSECDIEETKLSEKSNYRMIENNYGSNMDEQNDFIIRNEEETYEPSMKTTVFERSHETCFSMEPVPVCKNNDKIESSGTKKVSFTCLPKQERETLKLVKLARSEILNFEGYEIHYTTRTTIPTMCLAY